MSSFLRVKFSGAVSKALQSRYAKWSQHKAMGARVVVPPALAWWYYQEFGTAGPYTIAAKDTTYSVNNESNPHQLVFFSKNAGGLVTRGKVLHPGLKPAAFVRKALPTIEQEIQRRISQVLRAKSVDSPEDIQAAVLHSVQFAKEEITTSMAAQLGHFQDGDDPAFGKLEGRRPEDVFRENATVEKIE